MATILKYSNMTDAEAFNSLLRVTVSFALAGDNVLVSAVTGKQILCYRLLLVVGGDTVLTFKSGVSTSLSGALTMNTAGSIVLDLSNVPWFQTGTGKDFILSSTNSVQVSGILDYQTN